MNLSDEKFIKLKEYIKSLKSVIVAYSSGVDSTFLLKVAHDTLSDNVIAVTLNSSLYTKKELDEAIKFCEQEKIKHIIIDVDVLNIKGLALNPPDRCYLCKKELFKKIIDIKNKYNIENIIEGSNLDDEGDYRPGSKAIKELDIKSPLKTAKLNKSEIRELSKELGLNTFDKPSMACLASRIPYGEDITVQKLKMIEQAERYLFEIGFKQLRVRLHAENLARIEVSKDDFEKLLSERENIISKLKKLGFKYVSMDIEGFRSGAMNEVL